MKRKATRHAGEPPGGSRYAKRRVANETPGVINTFISYELQRWRVANFGSVIQLSAQGVSLITQDGQPPRRFKTMADATAAVSSEST